MIRYVYASPDIRPEVWTPTTDTIVLPLNEQPGIVAESRVEKLPPGAKRTDRKAIWAIMAYLRTHPPADYNTIAHDLGLTLDSVKNNMWANKRLFCAVGKKATKGRSRVVWAMAE